MTSGTAITVSPVAVASVAQNRDIIGGRLRNLGEFDTRHGRGDHAQRLAKLALEALCNSTSWTSVNQINWLPTGFSSKK